MKSQSGFQPSLISLPSSHISLPTLSPSPPPPNGPSPFLAPPAQITSAIMVPKELITQRMQAGAKGRSWQVFVEILQNDGVMGLYAGYSATHLRNLPAEVLSYSSFELLRRGNMPLDVVKTRLMTQVRGEGVGKIAAVMYGISATVKQILKKEEGWVRLTRGMGPRMPHIACFSALGYFAFETARLAILQEYLRRKETQVSISIG